jgi:hypothetical protein
VAGLKKSEKRLLIMFGLALFVVVNLVGDNLFKTRKDAAKIAIKEHRKKIVDYEGLLRTSETWDARRSWLSRQQPRFVSENAAATEIENHVVRSAAAAGATIDQSKPTEPIFASHYVQVALEVSASGSDAEVTRFLSLLQSREGFYAIPGVSLITDRKDPSILRGKLTVARWYSNAPTTPVEAPPAIGVADANLSGVANRN